MPITLKHIILLVIMSVQVFALKAQSKQLTTDSDTSFWYNYQNKIAAKLHFENLNTSSTKQEWRMWFNGQVTSYVLILKPTESRMILYTQESRNAVTELCSERIYSKAYNIDAAQIKSIDSLKEVYGINEIPTESQIKGWGDVLGLDGVTYVIEKAKDNSYSFKSYWSPQTINAGEAKTLTRFIKAVELVAGNCNRPDFVGSIPFLSYNTGGPAVAMKVATKKQARSLRKARKAYRKSHPDTAGKAMFKYK